jgi:hypothetical protein
MIAVLLSQTYLLFPSLRHDCCLEENNNHVRERRITIMSERRTTIISERREEQSCLREESNNPV